MKGSKIVTTSVVRSAYKGQSHGGVYLVDLEAGSFDQMVDWNKLDIDWAGRGLDRGLRGIAFHDGRTYIAASDEILVYDQDFRRVETFSNCYLRHCHEIDIGEGRLWATSTGFDSVLGLDLRSKRFDRGYCLRDHGLWRWRRRVSSAALPRLTKFDPQSEGGPPEGDTLHVNMVRAQSGALFVAGTGLGCIVRLHAGSLSRYARVPCGTHNAQPYGDGVLVNDTRSDRLLHTHRDGSVLEEWPVVKYDERDLDSRDLPSDHARQAFARGLCRVGRNGGDGFVLGSSPATLSLYVPGRRDPVHSVNLTRDVRNAIHGLEVYPY